MMTQEQLLTRDQIDAIDRLYRQGWDVPIDALLSHARASVERIEFLEAALKRIASKQHSDRSCSLEAQGFDETECAIIGERDSIAQIAVYALKGKVAP